MILLSSCKKDIEVDYHQVDPLYVVEASVSDSEMKARISQTNDMDDNSTDSNISNAVVVITGSDGSSVTLPYVNNGTYRSSTAGTPGVEYRIDIDLDGHHFSSSSVMQEMPELNDFHFMWKDIIQQKLLMAEALIQDIPNQDNWYFIHLYRNGSGLRWAMKRDDVNPDGELQQQLRSIDKRTYDYFYSMQIMGNTGTNPIQNFTGGCLGYFSAYSEVTYDCVFHTADVEIFQED